ncbi:hypothetical protein AAZX31_11G084200 [Glycine max]|nr:Nucleoside-triphosphatase THEP1 [Glycine soja]
MRVLESLKLNASLKLPLPFSHIKSIHYCKMSLRWPNVGKYKVDVASFESLALLELQVREDTDLFIIDEVGKMELFSSSFFPAVLRVFGVKYPIARLRNHAGATCFTLSVSNRDAVREKIRSQLEDLLTKH